MATKTDPIRGLYRGYSTFEFQRIKQFQLLDVELVKFDLLNHIFTRRGERVMMPTFGTIIPDLVFEPMTQELVDTVEDELRTVFKFDPRVKTLSLSVVPLYDQNRLEVHVRLLYIELETVDEFDLNIEFEQT